MTRGISVNVFKSKHGKELVRKYREELKSTTDLAKEYKRFGVSQSTIQKLIRDAGASRTVSEAMTVKTGGWRHLHKVPKGNTRWVTIPSGMFKQIAVDPNVRLEGKWRYSLFNNHGSIDIKEKELILKIREIRDKKV